MNSGAASMFIVYSQHTESMFSSHTPPLPLCVSMQGMAEVPAVLSARVPPRSRVSVLLLLWMEPPSRRTPPHG